MKSKALFLMIAGFLTISACSNPIMEKLIQTAPRIPPNTQEDPPAVTYTVDFESDGGSLVDSLTVAEGEKATRPENPEKSGFGFVNWYDNGGCAGDCYDFETPVTDDITLYAQWSETFHRVIFMDGETELYSQSVGENGTASKPVPTKEGHTFDGWYSDPELTALYDFDTPVTGGFTLYAKWTLNTYTVTFKDGDTVLTRLTRNLIPHGSTVSRPETDPRKDGYTFDDWYSNSELTTLFSFSTPITDNTTVYAKWIDQGFPGEVIHNIFNVSNIDEWNTAKTAIGNGGDNKNYIINVIADFNIAGTTTNSFGSANGIKVFLRGTGRTLTLSDPGNLLRIGSGQSVILRDLTLRGCYLNNNSVVYMSGTTSSFTMQSGKISGNSSSGANSGGGGGVCLNGGTFTMNDGEISNNSVSSGQYSNGGGVYVKDGTFTMNGGKISGNSANNGGGVSVTGTFTMYDGEIFDNSATQGGGVCVTIDGTYYGTFYIVTGTIYGKYKNDRFEFEADGLRNSDSWGGGAALIIMDKDNNIIQYGTFNGNKWYSEGDLKASDITIRVVEGALQQ